MCFKNMRGRDEVEEKCTQKKRQEGDVAEQWGTKTPTRKMSRIGSHQAQLPQIEMYWIIMVPSVH